MPTKAIRSLRPESAGRNGTRPPGRREWIFIAAGWFAASLSLIVVDQARLFISRQKAYNYQEGDIAEEDFYVEESFEFVDEESTEKVVNLNRSLAPPVYEVRQEITDSVLERFDRFASFLKTAVERRLPVESVDELRSEFPGAAGLLDLESYRNSTKLGALLEVSREALEELQYGGVFRLHSGDGGASGVIEVVYPGSLTGRRVTLIRDAVIDPDGIPDWVRGLPLLTALPDEDIEFVTALVSYFSEPNGYHNESLSLQNRNDAEAATEPVVITVASGTKLLSAGKVVTSRQAAILSALKDRRQAGFHEFLDPFLFMAVIFALGIVGAVNFGVTLGNPKTLWLYVALAGTYVAIASALTAFVRFRGNMDVAVVLPTALYTLLLAQLLQDRRMAVLSSILMALLLFFLRSGDGHGFLVTLAAGIAGTLAVKKRETRMGLLRAGPRLALIMSVFTLLSGILMRVPMARALTLSAGAALNGLTTGILSLAFLPLLEHVLNTATTFRLIELSDQNVPILKRMRLQAPGTYIHSQNVAHLAEAACDAIGANGLLARVGAYYHDIGKVDQAHLFVENQSGENKHDDLKASLSVAVIKSHVKIGMEKGRDLRLPDEVLAVIEQHHGTSVIRYFYDRALKEKGGDSVSPEDFSYGGPKPDSREAAVVMLADSAEAATRTLKKPTAAKLEKYIWDLIMERFRTGELNCSDLTLRDLETVKATFVHVLTGHFHTRIEYPKENGETES